MANARSASLSAGNEGTKIMAVCLVSLIAKLHSARSRNPAMFAASSQGNILLACEKASARGMMHVRVEVIESKKVGNATYHCFRSLDDCDFGVPQLCAEVFVPLSSKGIQKAA